MQKWYDITKAANRKSFAEMKKDFNSADSIGNDRYVFDVKRNRYRIIALLIFKVRTVFILFIGSHKEYDKLNASQVSFKK
ncbi:MAG: type II toxin-antitoxin system HigB family toxin [Ginsengibacter sp.]